MLKECYGIGQGSNYISRKQASSLKKEGKLRSQYYSNYQNRSQKLYHQSDELGGSPDFQPADSTIQREPIHLEASPRINIIAKRKKQSNTSKFNDFSSFSEVNYPTTDHRAHSYVGPANIHVKEEATDFNIQNFETNKPRALIEHSDALSDKKAASEIPMSPPRSDLAKR